jgi:hypothetical protein
MSLKVYATLKLNWERKNINKVEVEGECPSIILFM